MQTRPIPHTDLTPSVLCLGAGDLGGSIDRPAAFALLDAFHEAGGTFIDTAKVYSDWLPGEKSRSEKTIGAWLKERRCRAAVIIATKGAHPELNSMHIPRLSPAEITADLEASLRHLGVETIDLYYLHRDDPARPVAEIIETLEAQARAGKIRAYGCSNWRPERIRAAQSYAAAQGYAGFCANQPLWNFARIDAANVADPTLAVMDGPMWALHHETGLACVPYSAQANGFFHKLLAGRVEQLSPFQRRMYLTDENRARAARLAQFQARSGLTVTQIILGYLLSQPFPTFPIVGCHTLEHLRDTLAAAGTRLDAPDLAFLDGRDETNHP